MGFTDILSGIGLGERLDLRKDRSNLVLCGFLPDALSAVQCVVETSTFSTRAADCLGSSHILAVYQCSAA